ncbi:MAG: thioredoxin domain-containing protein [bacterium]
MTPQFVKSKKFIGIVAIILALALLAWLFSGTNSSVPALAELYGVSDGDPIIGSANPSVVVVHYGDFENEASHNVSLALSAMLREYPDDLLVAWKDFPNTSLNAEALPAAVAARCAGRQGSFWPFHDLLTTYYNQLGDELYTDIAAELALNERSFASCLDKQKTLDLINTTYLQGLELNLITAPTIFINGKRLTGTITERQLKLMILDELGL